MASKAYQHYSQLLIVDPTLESMSNIKRSSITQRYYQYESKNSLSHLISEHDPRLTEKSLTEEDIININNKVDFEKMYNEQRKADISNRHVDVDKKVKKKKKVKVEPQIKKDITNNMMVVVFILGGFLLAVIISLIYWYQQNKEKDELIHSKHEEYLQSSIKKYEDIVDFIALLETRRNLSKKDPNFEDFRCQASIQSLIEINNEIFALISSAKKTKSKDKDIDKFIQPLYKKAKDVYATAPDSKKIKF